MIVMKKDNQSNLEVITAESGNNGNEILGLCNKYERYKRAIIETYGIVPFSRGRIIIVDGTITLDVGDNFEFNGRKCRDIFIQPDERIALKRIRFSGKGIFSNDFYVAKGDKIRAFIAKGLLDGEILKEKLERHKYMFDFGEHICVEYHGLSGIERAVGITITHENRKIKYIDEDYTEDMKK